MHQNVGCIEVRWAEDDPDDVVAPWPSAFFTSPVSVHVERMDDGVVWFCIRDEERDCELHMNLYARRKGVLEWTVQEWR
jgi:hypothetical protein